LTRCAWANPFAGLWRALPAFPLVVALAAALAIAPVAGARAGTGDIPNIACASDLKFAIDEIAGLFAQAAGKTVRPNFGSSGNFYRQILEGAPFQLYLSADMAFAEKLAEAGVTEGRAELYAIGRIVLFAPKGSPLDAANGIAGLKSALAEGRIRRFAIANPVHAPYGRAAEQALRSAGLWEALQNKLVFGENVSQAAQFATTGSVDGAIFAHSLALSPAVSATGSYLLLPEQLHQPLRQGMVLLKGAGATAKAFHEYLQSPAARSVFRKYGFLIPGEAS